MNQTEETIRNMIAAIAGVSPDLPPDGNLYLELGVASVHAMQLLAGLEEHFGVTVPDEEFVGATSISKLVRMVDDLIREPKDPAHA